MVGAATVAAMVDVAVENKILVSREWVARNPWKKLQVCQQMTHLRFDFQNKTARPFMDSLWLQESSELSFQIPSWQRNKSPSDELGN